MDKKPLIEQIREAQEKQELIPELKKTLGFIIKFLEHPEVWLGLVGEEKTSSFLKNAKNILEFFLAEAKKHVS